MLLCTWNILDIRKKRTLIRFALLSIEPFYKMSTKIKAHELVRCFGSLLHKNAENIPFAQRSKGKNDLVKQLDELKQELQSLK